MVVEREMIEGEVLPNNFDVNLHLLEELKICTKPL